MIFTSPLSAQGNFDGEAVPERGGRKRCVLQGCLSVAVELKMDGQVKACPIAYLAIQVCLPFIDFPNLCHYSSFTLPWMNESLQQIQLWGILQIHYWLYRRGSIARGEDCRQRAVWLVEPVRLLDLIVHYISTILTRHQTCVSTICHDESRGLCWAGGVFYTTTWTTLILPKGSCFGAESRWERRGEKRLVLL